MRIIALVPQRSAEYDEIRQSLTRADFRDMLELVRDAKALMDVLKMQLSADVLVVACPASQDELVFLASHRRILASFRLLLVLPESSETLVALGHSLSPRMVLFPREAAKCLSSVLAKILRDLAPP